MKSPLALTIAYSVAAILFAISAWLQRNDIDPQVYYQPSSIDAALWFGFYLLIAILFVVAIFRAIPKWLLIIAAIACLVEMGLTAPGLIENLFGENTFNMTQVSMSAEDPRVELSREFFGAFLALIGVAGLFLQQRRKKTD